MTIRFTRHALALTLLASLCCSPAFAQGQAHPDGLYIGLSGGQSRARHDTGDWARRAIAGSTPALALSGLGSDSRDRAYRVFLGQQMSRNWALELGYFDLGRFGLQAATTPAGSVDARMKVRGAGLDLVGTLPMGNTLDLLFRAGAQHARTRSEYSGSGAAQALQTGRSERGWGYKAGVGLQAALGSRLLLRGEAEEYRVPAAFDGHMKVRVYSVSLVIPLGDTVAPRQAMLPAVYAPPPRFDPPPAALPPPPVAPVAMAPPAPPPPRQLQRVSFAAESLFAFDRSELRPEGRSALDTFAREAAGTQFEVMVVQGHTDRLGSAAYNQALSLRRAEAVKAYLVSAGGFAADKISTAGLGEGSPTTQPGDCKGTQASQALRDCLQPDRRVDVELKGSR